MHFAEKVQEQQLIVVDDEDADASRLVAYMSYGGKSFWAMSKRKKIIRPRKSRSHLKRFTCLFFHQHKAAVESGHGGLHMGSALA